MFAGSTDPRVNLRVMGAEVTAYCEISTEGTFHHQRACRVCGSPNGSAHRVEVKDVLDSAGNTLERPHVVRVTRLIVKKMLLDGESVCDEESCYQEFLDRMERSADSADAVIAWGGG